MTLEKTTYKYKAFISYSHKDKKFARWIHKQIENYKIPKSLREKYPNLPKGLKRTVFIDDEELPTASALPDNLSHALESSELLIVLCSPQATQSYWVDKEIAYFKHYHGEGKEYYLDIDNKTDECIDDEEVTTKNCLNSQCYEDIFVPDCRKIIEIYDKYFKNDFKNKKMFIKYLVKHTNKSESSIGNYLSCKSCNHQVEKFIYSSLKISDSTFKQDFCFNLEKKFNYVSLFETDYISVKQFLLKEHEANKDNYKPTFTQEDKMLTKNEEERLFDLTHVSKDKLKSNLSDESNMIGSNSYKLNLALAAFNRNLINESDKIVTLLLSEKDLLINQELLELKAKILSSQEKDKDAIKILDKLVDMQKPNIDTETNNLLAASIKRDAFNEFKLYKDEEQLRERLTLSKDIYFYVYKLNNDYYPALNYMYIESMLAYSDYDDVVCIEELRAKFKEIWSTLNYKVSDWWSYIANIEYLILQGDYRETISQLEEYFNTLEEYEINDFNILSTIRQLELFSEFCTDKELREIINLLKDYIPKN